MLWQQAFLETRWRFLIGLIVLESQDRQPSQRFRERAVIRSALRLGNRRFVPLDRFGDAARTFALARFAQEVTRAPALGSREPARSGLRGKR